MSISAYRLAKDTSVPPMRVSQSERPLGTEATRRVVDEV